MNNKFLITLLNTKNLARKRVKKIIENNTSAPCNLNDILILIQDKKNEYKDLYLPSISELQEGEEKAKHIIDKCNELGIKIISCFDNEYPENFKLMDDAPILFYAKGNYLSLNNQSIAVIGTRNPSKYGSKVAFRVGELLAENKIAVVSGLAIGCDTEAHKGCLKAKGFTVAILANGLDYNMIYPKENTDLARKIVEFNGCLLSEYEPLAILKKHNFVERDRLQAGLSKAVFVIETTVSGGTMHAVNTCIKEKRILACLKHPDKFETEKSKGNEKLLAISGTMGINDEDAINMLICKVKGDYILHNLIGFKIQLTSTENYFVIENHNNIKKIELLNENKKIGESTNSTLVKTIKVYYKKDVTINEDIVKEAETLLKSFILNSINADKRITYFNYKTSIPDSNLSTKSNKDGDEVSNNTIPYSIDEFKELYKLNYEISSHFQEKANMFMSLISIPDMVSRYYSLYNFLCILIHEEHKINNQSLKENVTEFIKNKYNPSKTIDTINIIKILKDGKEYEEDEITNYQNRLVSNGIKDIVNNELIKNIGILINVISFIFTKSQKDI